MFQTLRYLDMEEETQREPVEVQLELLRIAKIDGNRMNPIKKNLQFITWYLIISLVITAMILAQLFGETGYFRAY